MTPFPSRISKSAWALEGTRISPLHNEVSGKRSGRLPWAVTTTGRVCGTAIGIDPMLTDRVTPNRSMTSPTARAKASQRTSGSGPLNSKNGVPPESGSTRTTSRGAS